MGVFKICQEIYHIWNSILGNKISFIVWQTLSKSVLLSDMTCISLCLRLTCAIRSISLCLGVSFEGRPIWQPHSLSVWIRCKKAGAAGKSGLESEGEWVMPFEVLRLPMQSAPCAQCGSNLMMWALNFWIFWIHSERTPMWSLISLKTVYWM